MRAAVDGSRGAAQSFAAYLASLSSAFLSVGHPGYSIDRSATTATELGNGQWLLDAEASFDVGDVTKLTAFVVSKGSDGRWTLDGFRRAGIDIGAYVVDGRAGPTFMSDGVEVRPTFLFQRADQPAVGGFCIFTVTNHRPDYLFVYANESYRDRRTSFLASNGHQYEADRGSSSLWVVSPGRSENVGFGFSTSHADFRIGGTVTVAASSRSGVDIVELRVPVPIPAFPNP
jgi:hypothetical protein